MITKKQVVKGLEMVLVPGVMRSVVKMNLVSNVNIADGRVDITLASAALAPGTQEWLKDKINDAASGFTGVNEANINFVDGKPKDLNEIGHVIAIMSGKGGVGKFPGSQPCRGSTHALRLRGGYPGCRYHGTQHTKDVWNS